MPHPASVYCRKSASGATMFILFLFLAAFVSMNVSGCASSRDAGHSDSIEKWIQQAEASRAHSPSMEKREMVDIEDFDQGMEENVKSVPEKSLPEEKVTLRLRNAPVPTVLRAMAESADQNILINETISGTMSINIKGIPWNHAFLSILESQGLTYSWEGSILRIKSMKDLQQEIELMALQQEASKRKRAAERSGPMTSRIMKINYADAGKLSELVAEFLEKGPEGEILGDLAVDPDTNSIIIHANRHNTSRIQQMIERLDRPRAQILIEANIVEANQETARELGMRWSGRYINSSGSLDDFGIAGDPSQPVESFLGADGMNLGLVAGRITGNVLYAQLEALQRDGKLNILSSPSITTMDNQLAYTEHGERVPFETTDDEGRPEVEFQDAVLRLEVVPQIIGGRYMKMRIKVQKDQVDFTQTVEGNPLIRAKETETILVVEDGETIVISGLSKQTVSETDEGLPGFKDMPGLGWLFKGVRNSNEMEEFMIFITPTILGTKTP